MRSLITRFLTAILSTEPTQLFDRQSSNWTVGQEVQTSSGPVKGHAASNASSVSEYLGIPFAQPPIGDLRFAPPVAYNSTSTNNGSSFGYSCPVVGSGSAPSGNYNFANLTQAGREILKLDAPTTSFSEDCLTLNVWTQPQTGESPKAVMIWIYGGGFQQGSTSYPTWDGQNLASEQDVVVVSMNYRTNIFGFPGNPDGTNNLGLLDQRLAVEWVQENIANFGGDPTRMVLFGQSAGASSVDFYSYAWKSDPIVTGFIPESGTVFSFELPNTASAAATSWYYVTSSLGYPSNLGAFVPTVDNTVIFSNYSTISPASLPILIGSNDNEAAMFIVDFALNDKSFSQSFWDTFNLQEFTCPSSIRANTSLIAKQPTWRYRYFGEFPDSELYLGSGAWHGSEIPMIFNTNVGSPAATAAEVAIGSYMRGAWAAFAKDPVHGLTNYGWPAYVYEEETLVRLAWSNETGTNVAYPETYDAACGEVNVSAPSPNPSATGTGGGGGSGTSTATPSATTTKKSGVGKTASLQVGLLGLGFSLCLTFLV